MADSSTPKIPAWKLRQQELRKNRGARPPAALYSVNDELGGSRASSSRASRRPLQQKYGSDGESVTSSTSMMSSLSSRSTRSNISTYSSRSRNSNVSHHVRTIPTVSRVPDGLDPTLPPAFRAAFKREQLRREKTNANCLASSVASHSRQDARSTSGESFLSDLSSLDSDDDDNDFDDEDSFASIDSNADEEDDAYMVSRNQMARMTIETSRRPRDRKKVSRFQKKTTGVHGTPLGLIAE